MKPPFGFVLLYFYMARAVFNSFRIGVFWFAMNTAVLNEVNSHHHGGKQVNLDKYISAKQITHIQSALFQDRFDNKRRQLSVRMHRDCYPVSAIAHLIMTARNSFNFKSSFHKKFYHLFPRCGRYLRHSPLPQPEKRRICEC